MKRPDFALAAPLVMALSLYAATDAPTPERAPEPQPVNWKNAAVPGPAVTLRVHRTVGKSMIYQGTLDREQRSASSYREVDQFYVNSLCYAQEDGRDMVANLRNYLDRRRVEHVEKHKEEEKLLPNSSDLIDMGPNFNMIGTLRCYPFDAQNRLAYRNQQLLILTDGTQMRGTLARQETDKIKFLTERDELNLARDKVALIQNVPLPHIFINESPHYLFPILTERMVSPGETWRFRVPILIPLEQGINAEVLPTQFDLIYNAKLREDRDTKTVRVAVIDYQISGKLRFIAGGIRAALLGDFPQQQPSYASCQRRRHGEPGCGKRLDSGAARKLRLQFLWQYTRAAEGRIRQERPQDRGKAQQTG